MADTRNSNDLDSLFYATGGSLAPTDRRIVGETLIERTIPIRNLAADPIIADRVSHLIRDRNEMHGKLVLTQWALDRLVRDNEREVKGLRAEIAAQKHAIAEQRRKIDNLLARMNIEQVNNPDGLPTWHQPNPLPRGMRGKA